MSVRKIAHSDAAAAQRCLPFACCCLPKFVYSYWPTQVFGGTGWSLVKLKMQLAEGGTKVGYSQLECCAGMSLPVPGSSVHASLL